MNDNLEHHAINRNNIEEQQVGLMLFQSLCSHNLRLVLILLREQVLKLEIIFATEL